MLRLFDEALSSKSVQPHERLRSRFRVFCFKHDLEALVLAAHESLKTRLKTNQLKITWTVPVEDQDHNQPPKRVVEDLFGAHGDRYKDTVDAPLILHVGQYPVVIERCPQCFGPFVRFLERMNDSRI
ncbi:MAG: DUF4276 family protein [Acidobacteriota bacterium]